MLTKKMEKMKLFGRALFLLSIFLISSLISSCTFNHSNHGMSIDDELTRFLRDIPSSECYPNAAIINVLLEEIAEVFEDGRCRIFSHTVFKVIRDRGKGYADIKIDYTSREETLSILYARTITPEGKVIQLDKKAVREITPFADYPSYNDYKQLAFSMPGVTIGSVIDYKVVREIRSPVIEGKFSSRFAFQRFNPTLLCRYKIIAPQNMDLKYKALNRLIDVQSSPKVFENKNKKMYLWEYRNIPQIIPEDSMPVFDETAFHLLVTTMNSWEEFSHWWREGIKGKTEPNKPIGEKVEELIKGLSTNKEKTEAIFDYVKREIRYVSIDMGSSGYEPAPAQEVFANKYGDCKDKSTLLISMFKSAGIPAYYVLIPTNTTRNLIKDFPFPFQFDHCIVAIENEGGYQFIDPVATEYRVNYLPDFDQNRDVLIFKGDETAFATTPLAKPQENMRYNQYQIKIGMDGSMTYEWKNASSGDIEATLRSVFINGSPKEIREVLEKIADEKSPGAKLLGYTHSNPLNFKEGFMASAKYFAPNYCRKNNDIVVFPIEEMIKGTCLAKSGTERKYPIVISNNSCNRVEAEFNIPESYELFLLPEPVEIVNQFLEFRSSFRKEGEKIFYRQELIKKATRIPPEEYSVYQTSCQAMERSFKRDVLFRPYPPTR
jgi:hypothetical protein